jgi:hypothetical protein
MLSLPSASILSHSLTINCQAVSTKVPISAFRWKNELAHIQKVSSTKPIYTQRLLNKTSAKRNVSCNETSLVTKRLQDIFVLRRFVTVTLCYKDFCSGDVLLQETFCYRRHCVMETFCMETFCRGDVLYVRQWTISVGQVKACLYSISMPLPKVSCLPKQTYA